MATDNVNDPWATPSENKDFSWDTGGMDADEMGGGDLVNKEGWYHLEVSDVVPDLSTVSDGGKPKTPEVRFDMLVLQTVQGQSPAGSRFFHRIYVGGSGGGDAKEGSKKSACEFGIGLGLLTKKEIGGKTVPVDATTGEPKLSMATFMRAKGKQCVAHVQYEKSDDPKYQGKYVIKFGRVWDPSDPYVADVPKNAEALAMIGKSPGTKVPSPPPGGNGQKGQATFPQQPAGTATPGAPAATAPVATAASDDDLSDL